MFKLYSRGHTSNIERSYQAHINVWDMMRTSMKFDLSFVLSGIALFDTTFKEYSPENGLN